MATAEAYDTNEPKVTFALRKGMAPFSVTTD